MGLQEEIGYAVRPANGLQRSLQRIAAKPNLSPILARLVTPVDRTLHRFSQGKLSATSGLVAFPTIILATNGVRTGQRRNTPLLAVPYGDDLSVIGSNAGTGKLPGWVYNLRADPRAVVSYRNRRVDVVAREVDGRQYDEVFASAARIYPGFATYRERVDYRIPIFALTLADESKGE